MVKIVKKNRKVKWDNIIVTVFLITFVAYLASVTVLKAQNVVLAKQENQIERSNDKLSNDVANLELVVKQLDNRERVLQIAQEQGLKLNQKSIVSVADNSD